MGHAGLAQTATGLVTGEDGEPLPSASVLLDGGTKGVFTDINGRYSIELGAGEHTLEISFIGYLAQQKTFNLKATNLIGFTGVVVTL